MTTSTFRIRPQNPQVTFQPVLFPAGEDVRPGSGDFLLGANLLTYVFLPVTISLVKHVSQVLAEQLVGTSQTLSHGLLKSCPFLSLSPPFYR